MTETLMKAIVDCSTGETTYEPLTAEEIAEREIAYAEELKAQAAAKAEAEAKAEAKASALAKLEALGLTEEEASALIS